MLLMFVTRLSGHATCGHKFYFSPVRGWDVGRIHYCGEALGGFGVLGFVIPSTIAAFDRLHVAHDLDVAAFWPM